MIIIEDTNLALSWITAILVTKFTIEKWLTLT